MRAGGGRGEQRWRRKSCGAAGRRSFLPSGGGGERRPPPQDRDIYALRRKGRGRLPQTFLAEGDPGVHSPCPFATDHRPQTHLLTHHTPPKAVGEVPTGSFPISILSSIRTMARAPRHSRDSASSPRQSTRHRQARPEWGLSRPRGGSHSSAPRRPVCSQGGGRGAPSRPAPAPLPRGGEGARWSRCKGQPETCVGSQPSALLLLGSP